MTDEQELELERRLRSAGPPLEVPPGLYERARAEALDERPRNVVPLAGRRRRLRPALGLLAAVAAAAIAVAAFGLTRGSEPAAAFTVTMKGSGDAWAKVQLYNADGPSREVKLEVGGLPPAPQGRYYALWFASGKAHVSALTFNTSADGTATIETSTPVSMRWHRCWVTEEWSTSARPERTVMVSRPY